MPKLTITRGLPSSGKSTWALEQVKLGGGSVKRLNRDSLRSMVDGGAHSRQREQTIKSLERNMAVLLLCGGDDVIVDDTCLDSATVDWWRQTAKDFGADFDIKDFTAVPLDVCIERNAKRSPNVPEKVIRRMYREHLMPKPIKPPFLDGRPWVVLCDLDGTLALLNGRDPYNASTCEQDGLNGPVKDVLDATVGAGRAAGVILLSGRSEDYRQQTEAWLDKHRITRTALYMRPTGDSRKDAVVKRELYDAHIAGQYNVRFVLDDRDSVCQEWRRLGLTCFQVNYGDF